MDSSEARNLMEAYVKVYASPESNENSSFEEWVESLLDEGYDLSDYTWDELENIYLDEDRDGYGDDSKFKQDTDAKSFRPGKDVPKVKKFGRISRAMPASISGHATRTISNNTRAAGGDAGAPRSQKIAPKAKTTKMVKKDGKWVKEAYEMVLAHLVNEGYASDFDSARNIIVNMSEEWIHSIIEG